MGDHRRRYEEDAMLGFLLGVAIGYVLGTRAGREGYDQIMRTYQKVAGHPTVQQALDTARTKATEVVGGRQ